MPLLYVQGDATVSLKQLEIAKRTDQLANLDIDSYWYSTLPTSTKLELQDEHNVITRKIQDLNKEIETVKDDPVEVTQPTYAACWGFLYYSSRRASCM